jgi:hypothetical protein
MTVRSFIAHNLLLLAVGVAGTLGELAVWVVKAMPL